MNAAEWEKRHSVWEARLVALGPRLRENDPRNNRIHNQLFRGAQHALQMHMLCSRIERGCGHATDGLCPECAEAISFRG